MTLILPSSTSLSNLEWNLYKLRADTAGGGAFADVLEDMPGTEANLTKKIDPCTMGRK